MKTLKPNEIKSIEQFFQLKQKNLLKVMIKYLKSKYDIVYFNKDYIVAVGDIPVALVAHLDTVFTRPPENIFYDRIKNVMWSPEGLGADDRAGVYSIVQLIKKGYRPTIIFTTDEEKGALGAYKLVQDHPNVMTSLKYIIQLDRRGSNDCVFYDCDHPEFEKYVESFGFVTAFGSFSDISVICPYWGIAGVNLSIGYVNEHSTSEVLYIGNMLSTIEKVENMLKDIDNAKEYIYIESKYACKFYTSGYDFDYFDDDYGWDPSYGVSKELWKSWHTGESEVKEVIPTAVSCKVCGTIDYDSNMYPVKDLTGLTVFVCPDCISDTEAISWCKICGEAFYRKDNDNTPCCYDCLKEDYDSDDKHN